MPDTGNRRRGASTTEYIIIVAVLLGLILLLFGRTFMDMIETQIDAISIGVDPNATQHAKKKKAAPTVPEEPKLGGGDGGPGSPGSPGGLPVDSSGPIRTR